MFFAAASPADLKISIAAQPIFYIGDFPVTNAAFTGVIAVIIMGLIFFSVARAMKKGRHNRFVGTIQWMFEGLLKQIHDIIPDRKMARRITPLAVTIFFFVLINYWISIMPGIDSIKIDGVPILRSLAADLNFTLGLAIITLVTVQIYAIRHLGVFANGARYFRNPLKDPIGAFEGILELVGEFSRGIALSLRLFGNAFAGEVLLILIAILTGWFATVALPPFLAFELFIGFIQAYVFFVLTLIFTALAVSHHSPHDDHSPARSPKKSVAKGMI